MTYPTAAKQIGIARWKHRSSLRSDENETHKAITVAKRYGGAVKSRLKSAWIEATDVRVDLGHAKSVDDGGYKRSDGRRGGLGDLDEGKKP